MSIHVALEHRTTYRFDRPVTINPHVVRLRPAPHCRTPILAYSMTVEPGDHFVNWQQDPFGNFEARLVFPEPATELSIVIDLVADLTVINPFDFFLEPEAEQVPFGYEHDLRRDLGPYLECDPGRPAPGRVAAPGRDAERGHADGRLPRRPQPPPPARHRLHDPHGARRPGPGGHARPGPRIVSGHRLAARADPAAPGTGGPVRVGLPGAAQGGPRPDRGTGRPRGRLHRPPRLVRGVPARRRMGRPGSDLGPLRRRGPHPARRHPPTGVGRPGDGHDRPVRGVVQLRQPRDPHPRGPARHLPVHRRAVGPHRRARGDGRRPPARGRREVDPGRRADLRVGRRHGRRGVDHRRRRRRQAGQGVGPHPPPRRCLRPRRAAPLRAGQVVPGRAAAAMAARHPLAHRRNAPVVRIASCSPIRSSRGRPPRPRPRPWPGPWPTGCACPTASCTPPTRIRWPRSSARPAPRAESPRRTTWIRSTRGSAARTGEASW